VTRLNQIPYNGMDWILLASSCKYGNEFDVILTVHRR